MLSSADNKIYWIELNWIVIVIFPERVHCVMLTKTTVSMYVLISNVMTGRGRTNVYRTLNGCTLTVGRHAPNVTTELVGTSQHFNYHGSWGEISSWSKKKKKKKKHPRRFYRIFFCFFLSLILSFWGHFLLNCPGLLFSNRPGFPEVGEPLNFCKFQEEGFGALSRWAKSGFCSALRYCAEVETFFASWEPGDGLNPLMYERGSSTQALR